MLKQAIIFGLITIGGVAPVMAQLTPQEQAEKSKIEQFCKQQQPYQQLRSASEEAGSPDEAQLADHEAQVTLLRCYYSMAAARMSPDQRHELVAAINDNKRAVDFYRNQIGH